MRIPRSVYACLTSLALAASARAAALSPDPTGLWYDPAQPGWGASITQQGETLFVALFVYDANHQPTWYVASSVTDSGTHLDPIGSEVFGGALYRTTGPSLANATFDPTKVNTTRVGDLSLARGTTANDLLLTYTIDGTSVSRTVHPQIWSSVVDRLAGGYSGGVLMTSADPACQLPDLPSRFTGFFITPGSSPGEFLLGWGTGSDTACEMDATATQAGQSLTLSGPFACGPIGANFSSTTTLTLSELLVGPHGLTASAVEHTPACTYTGNAGGAVSPSVTPLAHSLTPDPTGIWFDPAAPGYGLSLTQQGTNIFAVLFAYGADNKAQWLVSSNVVDTGVTSLFFVGPGEFATPVFGGPLYRTSGPATGASGDNTAVTVTNVGNLQLDYTESSPPTLAFGSTLHVNYTVDGTVVTRTLQGQSWNNAAASFAGIYTGGLLVTGPTTSDCASNAANGVAITVSQGGTQVSWQPDGASQCTVNGAFSPFGNRASFSGTGQCVSNATPASIDQFSITELALTSHGFSGELVYTTRASLTNVTCGYSGTIGGVRR